ncbi:hypothetical protein CAEBREN_04562 [Caenorhabditis brenneri]|uniref:Uncharacterized protein n=1 Tax=Caenorhabditis brenneri TaxID=135651 RepID=G0M7E9_CAEBE|nr:hypothetical protein CAEBREN_04562 [Caenorhabditis brenneri]
MESSLLEQPNKVFELPEFDTEKKDDANSSNKDDECMTLPTDENGKDDVEAIQLKTTVTPESVSSPKDDSGEKPSVSNAADGSPAQIIPDRAEYRCSTPETFEEFMSKNSEKHDSPSRMPTKPWVPTLYGYNPNSPTSMGPSLFRLSIPNSPALSDFADQLSTPRETDKAEPAVAVDEDKSTVESDGDEPAAKKCKSTSDENNAAETADYAK